MQELDIGDFVRIDPKDKAPVIGSKIAKGEMSLEAKYTVSYSRHGNINLHGFGTITFKAKSFISTTLPPPYVHNEIEKGLAENIEKTASEVLKGTQLADLKTRTYWQSHNPLTGDYDSKPDERTHDNSVETLSYTIIGKAPELGMGYASTNKAPENKMLKHNTSMTVNAAKPRETIKLVFGQKLADLNEEQLIALIETTNDKLHSYEHLNLNIDNDKSGLKSKKIAQRTLELKEALEDIVKALDKLED
jgi:hypothetical protein